MATYVLVHGGDMSTDTWNRLSRRNTYPPGGQLGAKYWDGTAAYLESHGHEVFAPTLPDEHTHNLTDHIGGVCHLIESRDLRNVVLVGHSYGGMVITGIAERMPNRIRRLVYLDAALPDPGESLFSIFATAGIDPLSFPGLEAAPAYVETFWFDSRKIQRIPKTYFLCTESEFAGVTRIAKEKIAKNPGEWMYRELPASHVPMATMPDRFYRIMLEMANR
ncbi:alpha/beta hydrolase [uncultured Methanoregula sp.]|uniref:alpha/beta fold hydrolase n=1 Tax=uncultured Methanoregula sp. TaxID=1005933 RepID=UPI002AAABD55|nr:alpha/beta hydrolase [uncultured Methanoregula sp.]